MNTVLYMLIISFGLGAPWGTVQVESGFKSRQVCEAAAVVTKRAMIEMAGNKKFVQDNLQHRCVPYPK